LLALWDNDLKDLAVKLGNLDGIIGSKERLTAGWLQLPEKFSASLADFIRLIEAKPDQTATLDAQTFLTTAQIRLRDYREAMRKNKAAETAAAAGKAANEAYCEVMEDELNTLYQEVERDFTTFYRAINEEDEATFTAKLTPSEGRVGAVSKGFSFRSGLEDQELNLYVLDTARSRNPRPVDRHYQTLRMEMLTLLNELGLAA
jgi:hypothetical protein